MGDGLRTPHAIRIQSRGLHRRSKSVEVGASVAAVSVLLS
jgi:hypothetical protein